MNCKSWNHTIIESYLYLLNLSHYSDDDDHHIIIKILCFWTIFFNMTIFVYFRPLRRTLLSPVTKLKKLQWTKFIEKTFVKEETNIRPFVKFVKAILNVVLINSKICKSVSTFSANSHFLNSFNVSFTKYSIFF